MENQEGIEARLARVERLLKAIAEHVGFDLASADVNDGPSPEVLEYVRKNQMIQAIATYRNEMGVGLREAKDAVDEIKRRMQRR